MDGRILHQEHSNLSGLRLNKSQQWLLEHSSWDANFLNSQFASHSRKSDKEKMQSYYIMHIKIT